VREGHDIQLQKKEERHFMIITMHSWINDTRREFENGNYPGYAFYIGLRRQNNSLSAVPLYDVWKGFKKK
jgi:hypothetical protein